MYPSDCPEFEYDGHADCRTCLREAQTGLLSQLRQKRPFPIDTGFDTVREVHGANSHLYDTVASKEGKLKLYMKLYVPTDLMDANLAWGANCGPAALAAVLRRPVQDVQPFFKKFPGYTTPTLMLHAIRAADREAVITPINDSASRGRCVPFYGVAFLQFSGGWWDAKPPRVQYKFTHWIAVSCDRDTKERHVYDANADHMGGWIPHDEWLAHVMPRIASRHGATGCWVRSAWEVN